MENTATVSIKAIDSFLAPAIQQHTNTELWYQIEKDSVYDAIPLDGSYQIYNNTIITKPISKESFVEVKVEDPAWGVPFVVFCIMVLVALGLFLPELGNDIGKKKND